MDDGIDNDEQRPADAPPEPDMARLAAFSPVLASQALPQLYADGRKALALEWAPKLDPFATERVIAREGRGAPATGYGSLLDIAARSHDLEFLDQMARSPELRMKIFRERSDSLASLAAATVQTNPDFAEGLLARLDPEPGSQAGKHTPDGIVALAKAAYGAKRFGWLPRLDQLRRSTCGQPLPGASLAAGNFSQPPDAQGVRALLDLDCLGDDRERYRELASAFVPSDDPDVHALGRELLGRHHAMLIARLPSGRDDPRYSQTVAPSVLMPGSPHETPLAWIECFLEWGFDPFAAPVDGGAPAAAAMLAKDWRDDARSLSGDAALAVRRAREDALAPLLSAMATASPQHLDTRFELSSVGNFAKRAFPGARKIDCLALCVAQGYYRLADILLSAGADWKFASQQCSHMRPSRHDPPDCVPQAKAYFEAASLRSVSVKSSARRDARASKSSEASTPPQPPRPFRL